MDRISLPRDILRSLGEDLDEESKKERDIITSNRVKLTEYIHDVTLLFPYMKEKGVFTVGDCDLVRVEPTGTLKVDKFVDIFLTKGPKAIGVFHEALDAHFPAVFDYLAWLFTNAGVQLPPSRQLRGMRDLVYCVQSLCIQCKGVGFAQPSSLLVRAATHLCKLAMILHQITTCVTKMTINQRTAPFNFTIHHLFHTCMVMNIVCPLSLFTN